MKDTRLTKYIAYIKQGVKFCEKKNNTFNLHCSTCNARMLRLRQQ